MIAQKDIPKVRQAFEGTDYEFSDERLNNKKQLKQGVGHTQGEHEVIARHKQNEFHIGFFLFERNVEGSIVLKEYFMQETQDGRKVPMILERHYPKELVDLEYRRQETKFAGTSFKTVTPESVYVKKEYTKKAKDMLDIEVLKDKIDERKIRKAKGYSTILKVVKAPQKVNEIEK